MKCESNIEVDEEYDFEKEREKMKKEWEKIDKEKERNGKVFQLWGEKIVLSQDDIFFREIAIGIYDVVSFEVQRYEENFEKNVTSFSLLMDQMSKTKEIFLKVTNLFSTMAKKINVDCNQEMMLDIYRIANGNSLELRSVRGIYECYKEYEKLQKQLEDISNLLDLEKECRNKVIGIGHGMKGLLISSIQAGIINAGIGSLYDIKNNAKKRSLENKMNATLNSFATDSQVKDVTVYNFEMDLDILIEAFIEYLCKKTGREYNYSMEYNRKRTAEYVKRAESLKGSEQKEEYLFLLSYMPWNKQSYIDAYKKYGDERNELSDYCDFFNLRYIKNYKDELLRQEKEAERKKKEAAIQEEERKKRQIIEKEKWRKEEQERIIKEMGIICHRRELEKLLITNDFTLSEDDLGKIEDVRKQKKVYLENIQSIEKIIEENSAKLETISKERINLNIELSQLGMFSFGERKKIRKLIDETESEEKKIEKKIDELKKKLEEESKSPNYWIEKETLVKNRIYKKKRIKVCKELDQIYNEKVTSMAISKESLTFGDKVRWDIVDRYGSKMLLTTYAVDYKKKYNDKMKSVKWEDCTLRKWLNDDYINMIFNSKERGMLSNFPKLEISDLVFIFNEKEVKEYFPQELYRQCGLYGSPYHSTARNNRGVSWWLRSDKIGEEATIVNSNGYIDNTKITDDEVYIRPVICIDMANIFDEDEITKKYAELQKMGIV